MKKVMIVLISLLFIPSVSSAAAITTAQIDSIIGLLYAFNVESVVIDRVRNVLTKPKERVSSQPIQADNVVPTEPTPTRVVATTTQSVASKSPFIVTFKPELSDGTMDTKARLLVTSTAPWWFKKATVCASGCNITLDVPFNAGIPADKGIYTMDVVWVGTNVHEVIPIEVL